MSYSPLPNFVVLLVVCLFTLAPSIQCVDPTYSPNTLSDASGNSADSDSSITWVSLPDGEQFAASSPSRISEGLNNYYDLMHSFIDSVFNKGIPDELIEYGIDRDTDSIISNKDKYIPSFIGFGVCIGVGVLFILIFPLVSCCFCCCRLCGNCGGERQQLQKDADNVCKKYTFASILFVAIALVLVGTICIYLNNNNMTTTLNGIPDVAEANINDLKTYVNNTVKEAKHIVTNNFQFVQTALFRDLDNIAYLVGLPLKTDIEDNTHISDVLTSAYGLVNSLDSADAALTAVEANKIAMETAITNLETSLTSVTDALDTIFTSCDVQCTATSRPDYSGATPDIDTTAFPDLSGARTSMNAALATNLTQEIGDAEDEVEDIPFRADRDSTSTTDGVKSIITDLSDKLDEVLDQITDIDKQISGENAAIDLDKLIDDIKDTKELLEKYDKYRWYGGVGLATICLFVVVFVLLGLTCGLLGTSSSTPTHERGCVSNCGGIMLMVASALIFLFSALLMLLTFLTFVPGAPIHKVFCEPLTDLDKLEEYITIYNNQKVGDGKYFLGDALLSDDTISITVTGVLRDCRDGVSVFTALKLDNKFDLTDMLNYSKTLDVQAEIDAVNIDLSSVVIYSTELQDQLSDLKDAVNITFTDFYTELGSDITTVDLGTLANDIDAYVDSNGITNPHDVDLKAQATELRRIESEEYAYVEGNMTALNTSVSDMDDAVADIPADVDGLELGLQTADNYVQTNGSDVVRSLLNTYANRLLNIIDSYTAYTDTAVKTQMGTCEPIWNIYNSLLVYTFCYNLMDCFNGFWFSLGWVIFFFMPSLIFAVKLSKFFRRMNYPDDRLIDDRDYHPPPYSQKHEKYPDADPESYPAQAQTSPHNPATTQFGKSSRPPHIPTTTHFGRRTNKVAHHDELEECASVPVSTMPQCGPGDNVGDNVPQHLYCDNSDIALSNMITNAQLTEVETHILRQDRTEDMNTTEQVDANDYSPTETTDVEDYKPVEYGKQSETMPEGDNEANTTETTDVEDSKPVEYGKHSETMPEGDNEANTTETTDVEDCKAVEYGKQSETITEGDNEANTTETNDVEDSVHIAYGEQIETIPDAVNRATIVPFITAEKIAYTPDMSDEGHNKETQAIEQHTADSATDTDIVFTLPGPEQHDEEEVTLVQKANTIEIDAEATRHL